MLGTQKKGVQQDALNDRLLYIGGLSEFRSSWDLEERDFSLKLRTTIDVGP